MFEFFFKLYIRQTHIYLNDLHIALQNYTYTASDASFINLVNQVWIHWHD